MRKQLVMGVLLLIGLTFTQLQFNQLHGQNLVQNPSFETYNPCPNTLGQLSVLSDWYSLNGGTPDYFNACTNSPLIDVPSNDFGTQAASTGDGYVGFIAFGEEEAREYVSVPLSEPMVVGQTYCVDFKVSLGDESFYGIQDIGALFTTTLLETPNGGTVVETTPQILYTEEVIVESQTWVTISGLITADQPYQHMHIGNFFNNENTTGGGTFVGAPDIIDSYYYLDDVSVQALVTELLNIPETQQICSGDFVSFTAISGNPGSFKWYSLDDPDLPLSNNATLSQQVFESTTFVVSADIGSCPVTDTVFVETVPIPNVDFLIQNACVDQGTMLVDLSENVLPGATYEWDVNNDGVIESTTAGEATIVFENAGNYVVSLTINNNDFCFATLQQSFSVTEDCDPCETPFNYVPNSGFESFEACPDDLGLEDAVSDWFYPTIGTSDFFHTCVVDNEDPLDFPGVPVNTFGTQSPLDGNGYTGFIAYRDFDEYHEYVSVELVEPLLAGQTYCMNFNVSLADNAAYAIGDIGAYFSETAPSSTEDDALPFSPQISNTSGIITDINGWTNISGTFTPTQNLNYLTIGNFTENANTATSNTGNSGPGGLANIAYYYLDEVSISSIPNTDFDPMGYGICEGGTLNLTAPEGFCDYSWYAVNDPNIILSSTAQFTYTSTQLGPQEIAFVGGKNDCNVTETFTITTNTAPTANFAFDAGCFQEVVAFVNLSENTVEETIFQWDFNGDGIVDQVGGSIGHFYQQAGSYNVTLTVINPGGCSTSVTQTVNVSSECDPCNPSNLLFNPGFEFYGDCPNELGDITNAIDWFSPTDNPADFFNTCSNNGITGIPNNQYGSLDAFEGGGYAGLVAYVENDNYREFISTELPTPLVVGQQYCIGFKVHISSGSGFAIDRLGAYFTEDEFIPVENAVPQAVNEAFDIIFTPGWVEVSAVFTANQPYEFLTLGNFYDIADPELNALDIPNGPNNDTAYYYIDNVSLVATDLEITGTASSICLGDMVTITANTTLCEHQWTELGDTVVLGTTTTLNVNPAETTTYIYTGSNLACEAVTAEYTVEVFQTPNIGPDRFLCPGIVGVTLNDINGGATSYNWSPSEDLDDPFAALPIASPDETTTYVLQVQYEEPTPCPTTDTLVVFVIPTFAEVYSPQEDVVCNGQPHPLSVGGGIEYQWGPVEFFNDPTIPNPEVTLTETMTVYVDILNPEGTCTETRFFMLTVVDCDLGGPDWVDSNNNSIDEQCVDVVRNDTLLMDVPTVLDPDLPEDVLTYSLIAPSNGQAFLDSGILNYIPNQDYSGTDTLYIVACDEAFPVQCDTLLVCITVINEAPAFAQNDICIGLNSGETVNYCFDVTDDFTAYNDLNFTIIPDGTLSGTASIDPNNCLNYTASGNEGIGDSFEVVSCDPDGACDTMNVQILNFPVNEAPIVPAFSEAALQGISLDFCLEISDPNSETSWGEAIDIQVFNEPMNGTLTPTTLGCFSYTPDVTFVGTEFISFNVCDDGLDALDDLQGLCDETVSFTTNGEPLCTSVVVNIEVADGLVANDDNTQVEDNQLVIFDAIENDVPTNPQTVFIVENPVNGQVTVNPDNSFSYTPFTDYLGLDSLVYTICFPPLGCDTATWYIEVVNTIQAFNDTITTIEDQALTVPVISNDVYPELEQLGIFIIQEPSNGTASVNIDGGISYFPNPDFYGTDTFIYEICNGDVGCDQATAVINVLQAQPPLLQNDLVNTDIGFPLDIDFLANDSDPLGDTLIVKSFDGPSNGTITFDSLTLLLNYDPNDGYFGNDTITYTVCNSNGLTSTAMIIVNVNEPDCDLTIPGGFSPNGDQKNDLFEIQELKSCEEYRENELVIFNRWGNEVYFRINYGSDDTWWNGTWDNNNEDLPEGTYFYLIKTFYLNETQEFKGAIEIFR